jgi:hypothetical protein
MLPPHLRWPDGQSGAYSSPHHDMYTQSLYPTHQVQDMQTTMMFTGNLNSPPVSYPYAADIQVALLRTRYYYTKYLVNRPFVYKAMHHSDLMTHEDAEGVVECFKACLKWPIVMSPTCYHKRLIPYLFFWSQNLLSILLILHLSQQIPILLRIRSTMCGDRFEAEARETVTLCIEWIRDLKNIDPAAGWCWRILQGLYPLDE